jgi:hypothetical protein
LKKNILIVIIALCFFGCDTFPKECAKYKGQELIVSFDTEQIDMNSAAYEKYISNASRNYKKEIDLKVVHDNEITTISFVTHRNFKSKKSYCDIVYYSDKLLALFWYYY